MATQRELDEVYMNMAHELSKLSKAERKKVGCLIVKDTQIIHTKPEVLHAESNAITKLARSTNSSSDSTLYVTLAPCFECSKLIIQAGIKRVVFLEMYWDADKGLALLKKAGLEAGQLTRGKV